MPFKSFEASNEPNQEFTIFYHVEILCQNIAGFERVHEKFGNDAHADTFCLFFDCFNSKLYRIQVLLIVASETGHVHSYSTEKFEPVLNTQNGRKMIRSCLENLSIPESKDDSEIDAEVTIINEKYCQTDIGLSGFELNMNLISMNLFYIF